MPEKNKPIFLFSLNRIFTDQFAIIDSDFIDSESEKITFTHGMEIGGDDDNRLLKFTMKVNFKQNSNTFLIIESGCEFRMAPETWELFKTKDNDSKRLLPKHFAIHLVGLTVSSVRGILHAKTDNTKFNRFIIPLINVHDLVKDDIELNISNDEVTTK